MDDSANQPHGLGGWLILVGIGLVFSPLRQLIILAETVQAVFRDGAWQLLTSPASEMYHPLWGPLIGLELAANTAFAVLGLTLLLFYFTKSRRFPRWFVTVYILNLLFIAADAWLVSIVVPDQAMFDAESGRDFVRAVITVSVWAPYMFMSRRVENTFVN